MAAQFETSLSIALEQLDKKGWATMLLDMENKFHSIALNDDMIPFCDELLNTLWSLQDAKKRDAYAPLDVMFAIRFAKLEFWTIRFLIQSEQGKSYLNPLTATASDLKDAAVLQSSSAYPSEDIIKRWVRDNLQ